ncbi:hypothetical protein HDV00_008274 [Rhizophlyctis rosea]|nr:hypothetical protein HDV00_008274 [Rhizophlyctis rosea]
MGDDTEEDTAARAAQPEVALMSENEWKEFCEAQAQQLMLQRKTNSLENKLKTRVSAQQLVQAGAKAAKLACMIVTSSEFRSTLREVSSIIQEVLRSNVENASDDLANDPNVSESVRAAAAKTCDATANNDLHGAAQQLKGEVQGQEYKEQAKQQIQGAKEQAQGQAQHEQHLPEDKVNKFSDVTRNTSAKLYTGEQTPGQMANDALSQLSGQAKGNAQPLTGQAKGTAQAGAQQAKEQLAPLKDTAARVGQKLADMPPEERDEIIRRFKTVAKTLQNKPEFQRAFGDLTSLLCELSTKADTAADTVVEKVTDAPMDPKKLDTTEEATFAALNAKKLIENVANSRSLDPLIRSVTDFADKARSDDELTTFWTDLSSFITRSFTDPAYTHQSDYEKTAQDLVVPGRKGLSKYDYYTQKITYEASTFADALASHRATANLASEVNIAFSELSLDNRAPTFHPELLRDLAKIAPAIADRLACETEINDGIYHMTFDNIVLHSTILPEYIRVVADTTVDDARNGFKDQPNSNIYFEISHIEASARDVAWLVNKHSNFFKAGDVGLADFDIKDPGLTVRVEISASALSDYTGARSAEHSSFLPLSCQVILSDLDLHLHSSDNDFLYKVAKSVMEEAFRNHVADSVKSALGDVVLKLNKDGMDLEEVWAERKAALVARANVNMKKAFQRRKELLEEVQKLSNELKESRSSLQSLQDEAAAAEVEQKEKQKEIEGLRPALLTINLRRWLEGFAEAMNTRKTTITARLKYIMERRGRYTLIDTLLNQLHRDKKFDSDLCRDEFLLLFPACCKAVHLDMDATPGNAFDFSEIDGATSLDGYFRNKDALEELYINKYQASVLKGLQRTYGSFDVDLDPDVLLKETWPTFSRADEEALNSEADGFQRGIREARRVDRARPADNRMNCYEPYQQTGPARGGEYYRPGRR